MMNQRFWRPEETNSDAVLYPVGAVSSDQRLYLVMEGPTPPPPTKHETPSVFMMAVRIVAPSGEELIANGSGGSFGKTGPLTYLWDTPLPADLSGPLTVQLRREDGSIVYEAQMVRVLP